MTEPYVLSHTDEIDAIIAAVHGRDPVGGIKAYSNYADAVRQAALDEVIRRLRAWKREAPWPQFGYVGGKFAGPVDVRSGWNGALDCIEDEIMAMKDYKDANS